MKARGKKLLHVFMPVLVVCLLVLTCTAYAAPATTQKSPQQVQPTGSASPASVKYDPNAPPQGTITIPASAKGNVNTSTWVTGSYQYIQWTCNATYSKLVDVTLWQNNKQVVVISKGIASGQTGYRIPIQMAAGNYEVRITSQGDPRVEARKAVTVELPKISIMAPKQNEVLYLGDKYTIIWSYTGNPGALDFYLIADKGKLSQKIGPVYDKSAPGHLPSQSFPIGKLSSANTGMGQGSVVWTLTDQPPDNISLLFYLEARGAENSNIKASSAKFQLACKHSYCPVNYGKGYCANLLTDVWSCGWCGHNCSDEALICDQGKCKCPPHLTTCQGQKTYCADLARDNRDCGSCGNNCEKVNGPGFSCMNGSCGCFAPNAMCENKCINLQSDLNNCGKCGNKCAANQGCWLGVCETMSSPGIRPPVGGICPSGLRPYNIMGKIVCR